MFNYADVALDIPVQDGIFTYRIPNLNSFKVGCRVMVNFQNQEVEGIIVSISNLEPNYECKEILNSIDSFPIVTQEQINLAYWMKDFYLSQLGVCLWKMVPKLNTKGFKEKKFQYQFHSSIELNQKQNEIINSISKDLNKSSHHLIHGITGSGKTEIYIRLIQNFLTYTNSQILYLIPEIGLSFQIADKLRSTFGEDVLVIHSSITPKEKSNAYLNILNGNARLVLGTRSSIFSPFSNLGLIIMDEEHDSSYKENSNPRYHTRQIGFQRSKYHNAIFLMGSATPSVETYYRAKSKLYNFHEILQRANPEAKLPKVNLVKKLSKKEIISSELIYRIKMNLDQKHQTILLVNRRGHSPILYSEEKNDFIYCDHCSSRLCSHLGGNVLCHLCGKSYSLQSLKNQYGEKITLLGAGTQKVEEFLLTHFPDSKVERLDQDVTSKKDKFADTIQRFAKREIDILTGTQLISKGFDFPNVSLVGILQSEVGLGMPDFRSGERVFSLLTQMSGRSGRSEVPGEVFIETEIPDHYVFQFAKNHDYKSFYHEEIQLRETLSFPPFSNYIRLVTRSKKEEDSSKAMQMIGELLNQTSPEIWEVLGPSPCPFYKIDSNFRNHLIIRTQDPEKSKKTLNEILKSMNLPKSVYLEIDIDPIDLV
jgi:primosomal protein N' (replication factor Y)